MADARLTQDPKVLSVFEIVAAYVTDTLFNHIYHGAVARLPAGTSVTDEYLRGVQAYVTGVKADKQCYAEVANELHKHFAASTRLATLSYAGFVDRVVQVCIPADYLRAITADDKDGVLGAVVCDLVANLAAYATRPEMLRRIIDNHAVDAQVTVRMLQDAGVGALIGKRAELHNRFLRKLGQARDGQAPELVEDIKRALVRVVKEKAALQADLAGAEGELRRARERLRESRASEAKLRRLVELLRRGREDGPAIAGARLRAPRRDTLAEPEDPGDDPLDPRPSRRGSAPAAPGRRRKPDDAGDDEDDEDGDSDEDEGDEDSEESESDGPPPRRAKGGGPRAPAKAPAPKHGAPTKPAGLAPGFFNEGGGILDFTAKAKTPAPAGGTGAGRASAKGGAAGPRAGAATARSERGPVGAAPRPGQAPPAAAPGQKPTQPAGAPSAMLSALLSKTELDGEGVD